MDGWLARLDGHIGMASLHEYDLNPPAFFGLAAIISWLPDDK